MSRFVSHQLNEQIGLHLIREEKFKTYLIKFCFQRPLREQEVTANALLGPVLKQGTKSYPSLLALSKKLEELYGALLEVNVAKKGERQIVELILTTADMRYIEDQNLLKAGVALLDQVLYHPVQAGKSFSPAYVNQEKKNLADRIASRINDKNQYALERCAEKMCQDEPYGLYEWGREEELERWDGASLYQYYEDFIQTSPADILVVGNLEMPQLVNLFQRELSGWSKKPLSIPREQVQVPVPEVKEVRESMDVSQGKLTLGYRTNIPYEDPEYTAMMFFSNLVAGGAHSRLFKEIREKKSLCYYIYARLEKFKSILLITCGIEPDKYQQAVDLIKEQIQDIQQGNLSPVEMESTRQAMINWIRGLQDYPGGLADYYHTQLLCGEIVTPETLIRRIESVTPQEIARAAGKLQLDTLYFLGKESRLQ